MTAISETAPIGTRNRPHAGLWRRTMHALGKLGAKMLAFYGEPAAPGREVPPEAWRFPPF